MCYIVCIVSSPLASHWLTNRTFWYHETAFNGLQIGPQRMTRPVGKEIRSKMVKICQNEMKILNPRHIRLWNSRLKWFLDSCYLAAGPVQNRRSKSLFLLDILLNFLSPFCVFLLWCKENVFWKKSKDVAAFFCISGYISCLIQVDVIYSMQHSDICCCQAENM